jgi:hypothetical protein
MESAKPRGNIRDLQVRSNPMQAGKCKGPERSGDDAGGRRGDGLVPTLAFLFKVVTGIEARSQASNRGILRFAPAGGLPC